MAYRYQGPCERCGIDVDRNIKVGKPKRCLDCALEDMVAQHTDYANAHPEAYAKMQARNAELAAQFKAKQGPLYDKWKAGVERAGRQVKNRKNPAVRKWAEGMEKAAG